MSSSRKCPPVLVLSTPFEIGSYGNISGVIFHKTCFDQTYTLAIGNRYLEPIFLVICDKNSIKPVPAIVQGWWTDTGWIDAGVVPVSFQEAQAFVVALQEVEAEQLEVYVQGDEIAQCKAAANAVIDFWNAEPAEHISFAIEED